MSAWAFAGLYRTADESLKVCAEDLKSETWLS